MTACALLAPDLAAPSRTELLRLEHAIGAGLFSMRYQPQIGLLTGAITGVEALLRWDDPERGELEPDTFLPLAEAGGQLERLSQWALIEALTQAQRWQARGLKLPRISVNLILAQLLRPGFASEVMGLLTGHGLTPDQLTLELPIDALLDPDAADTLQALRFEGVHVAVDGFTGDVGSLKDLQELPVDEIKLDRSLVAALGPQRDPLLHATIALAHALGWRTVAVGVERDAQLDALQDAQCDEFQGHLIAPALSANTLADVLASAPVQHRVVVESWLPSSAGQTTRNAETLESMT